MGSQVVRGVSPDDDHLDRDDLAVRLPQFHRPVIPAPSLGNSAVVNSVSPMVTWTGTWPQ